MSRPVDPMVRYELTDRDSKPHEYGTLPHPSISGGGLELLLEIADIMGGALGQALKAMVMMSEKDGEVSVDLQDIATSIEGLPAKLVSKGGADLIKRILHYTRRDGIDLDKDYAFDEAYTANYGELVKAVGKVLQVNYSPFGKGGTLGLAKLLQSYTQRAANLAGAMNTSGESEPETGA